MSIEFNKLSPLGREARQFSVRASSIAKEGPGTSTYHLGESIKTLHQVHESATKLRESKLSAPVKTEIKKAKSDIAKVIDNLALNEHKPIQLLDTDSDSTGLAKRINDAFNELTMLISGLHTLTQENLLKLVQAKFN